MTERSGSPEPDEAPADADDSDMVGEVGHDAPYWHELERRNPADPTSEPDADVDPESEEQDTED